MRRHIIITLGAMLALHLAAGCNKSDDKQQAKDAAAPAAKTDLDLTTPAEKAIIGRWQLDRKASAAANMANAKLRGGLGYEFKSDGTGVRRLGTNPADPITWKTVTTAGDSLRITVTEESSSGKPTAVELTPVGADQLRVSDVLGSSILERTTGDVTLAQADYAPEVSAMAPVGSLDGGEGTGIKLALSRDGTSLVERIGMSVRKNFVRWDTAARKPVFARDLAGGTVLPVAMSGDGKLCVTGDSNGATIWNARTGEQLRSFAPRPGQGGTPVALMLNADSSLLVMAAGKNVIGWDTESGDERFTIKADPIEVTAAALFPNGKRIATGGKDNHVKIWNVSDGSIVRQLEADERNPATAIAISDDGHRLASAHMLGKIAVFDMAAGLLLRTIDPHHPRIEQLVFMPDNKTLVYPTHAATWDLAVTDTETGELRELLKGHTGSITAVVMAADGNTLYSAGDDASIKIWDLNSLNH